MSWVRSAGWVIGFHFLFWVVLVAVYPRSQQVQAFFFWNRWVRSLAGLGYVEMLLTWVPYLRRRLFAPFATELIADVHLEDWEEEDYFRGSTVRLENGELCPIEEAVPEVRGHVILEGESGLGKTTFIRRLVKGYGRLVVVLSATSCSGGVPQAIQRKLHGFAGDANYLSRLIYIGALDVIIDGLDEASPETRGRIVGFAKRFRRSNCCWRHNQWRGNRRKPRSWFCSRWMTRRLTNF